MFYSAASQQTEEEAEPASSTDVVTTTAATDIVTTTQGRAITTVTQSTPAPGPSVPVRKSLLSQLFYSPVEGGAITSRPFVKSELKVF